MKNDKTASRTGLAFMALLAASMLACAHGTCRAADSMFPQSTQFHVMVVRVDSGKAGSADWGAVRERLGSAGSVGATDSLADYGGFGIESNSFMVEHAGTPLVLDEMNDSPYLVKVTPDAGFVARGIKIEIWRGSQDSSAFKGEMRVQLITPLAGDAEMSGVRKFSVADLKAPLCLKWGETELLPLPKPGGNHEYAVVLTATPGDM